MKTQPKWFKTHTRFTKGSNFQDIRHMFGPCAMECSMPLIIRSHCGCTGINSAQQTTLNQTYNYNRQNLKDNAETHASISMLKSLH